MEPKSQYVPYKKDNQDGSNDLTANEGAGSTQPFRPNGWNEQIDEKTEGGQ